MLLGELYTCYEYNPIVCIYGFGRTLIAILIALVWTRPRKLQDDSLEMFENMPEGYPMKDLTIGWIRSGCWIWFLRLITLFLIIRAIQWIVQFIAR